VDVESRKAAVLAWDDKRLTNYPTQRDRLHGKQPWNYGSQKLKYVVLREHTANVAVRDEHRANE
jgi:hypothetical protein